MRQEFEKNGFVTFPFPADLRQDMLRYINRYIRNFSGTHVASLEKSVDTISDALWQKKMSRAFRIFPSELSKRALAWARDSFCQPFQKSISAVNVVLNQEVEENPDITEDHLAIYWRCVRPNKPDAGRAHRDAGFWDLEFSEGYDPKIPFEFNYTQNCMKIWIPLYGCTPDTTLRVIPGSHKMDIPTIVESTEYGRRPAICANWLRERESAFISPLELSEGACILFDMNLVHVGPRHNQQQLRISAEFNFISK